MLKSALTGEELLTPIFSSPSAQSITSLSRIVEGRTNVYCDPRIGHLQTNEMADINKYYSEEYQFFDESDEDDVLYKVIDNKKIFRQQHQVDTLISKIDFKPGMKILDFGCAKGTVLKRLHARRPDITPYLYDVSESYVHLWKNFAGPEQYSVYEPKKEWEGLFDIVTSFFAFEHTPDPLKELASIKRLLRPGGLIYMIVPNVYENGGDFIIADHVHHYSEISLTWMFAEAGFEIRTIDNASHYGAFVVIARNSNHQRVPFVPDPAELAKVNAEAHAMADYWQELQCRIRDFEKNQTGRKAAIYGAGVYGTFIASSLDKLDSIDSFIDQNPLIEGKRILNKPVTSPAMIRKGIEVIYVGLNPRTAKVAMQNLKWEDKYTFFFL